MGGPHSINSILQGTWLNCIFQPTLHLGMACWMIYIHRYIEENNMFFQAWNIKIFYLPSFIIFPNVLTVYYLHGWPWKSSIEDRRAVSSLRSLITVWSRSHTTPITTNNIYWVKKYTFTLLNHWNLGVSLLQKFVYLN